MKKTEIIVIADKSGSMGIIRDDVIGGFNAFIEDQKKEPGEARVTLVQFDSSSGFSPFIQSGTVYGGPMPTITLVPANDGWYELNYQGKPLEEVPLLDHNSYIPRNGTALYDAIGRTLNVQGERIKKEAWAEVVVVVIITDGQENASREYSQAQIQTMVKHAEEHGWKFVYLAANQDAFAAASAIGSNAMYAKNYTYDSAGTVNAFASNSETLKAFRSGITLGAVIEKASFDSE